MSRLTAVIAILIGAVLVGNALAVPAGKTVEWDTTNGKVTFDGKIHADKGVKCTECHVKIFQMKKGSAAMKMADINAGKFCGECHNGTRAFSAKEPANCEKCHKK
jgi:c(7)-type cytochrome triheme protein